MSEENPDFEKELARPATIEDLKNLVRSLDEQRADYLLIGGYALASHGYIRATTDIDILVAPTVESGEKIIKALLVLPEKAAKDIDPAWFPEGKNIRVGDEFIVDIMLNANGQTFDSLKDYAQTVEVDGILVKTVSLEGLLLTKKTMRDKDIQDCIVIEKALEIQHEEFQQKKNLRNNLPKD